jgi:hypothetical protein
MQKIENRFLDEANEFGRSFLPRYARQRLPPKQMELSLSA